MHLEHGDVGRREVTGDNVPLDGVLPLRLEGARVTAVDGADTYRLATIVYEEVASHRQIVRALEWTKWTLVVVDEIGLCCNRRRKPRMKDTNN